MPDMDNDTGGRLFAYLFLTAIFYGVFWVYNRYRRYKLGTAVLRAAAASMKQIIDVQPKGLRRATIATATQQLIDWGTSLRELTRQQAVNMLRQAQPAHMSGLASKLPGESDKQAILTDILRLAIKIAIEDDSISAQEVEQFKEIAWLLGLDFEDVPEMVRLAIMGVVVRQALLDTAFNHQNAEEVLAIGSQLSISKLSASNKSKILAYVFDIAIADGQITRKERLALESIIQSLGYRESLDSLLDAYLAAHRRATDDFDDDIEHCTTTREACAVLGVSASCTESELRTAYRSKMKQYHPDLMSDDQREAATRKAIQINEAYSFMKKQLRLS